MTTTNVRFITICITMLAVWAYVFLDGLLAMEAIWRRSDTFAHGYFVAPIVCWLVWRNRSALCNQPVKFSWLPFPILIGCMAVALFSYAADISVLNQLAAVIALIALLAMLLGNRLTWHYKFPLAYLIFMVPMGENLIPALQDITAWITVFLLKVHGIPVFRDGLYIQIPTGLFEVAVACSGIRYLIASVAVGTLFAYLSYTSFKKQVIFVIFALVLPIVANGIRAYLIVIIAHYSDMKYATGADHLVYGWLFFGLVIMLMFWIGGKFADPEISQKTSNTSTENQQKLALTAYLPIVFTVLTLLVVNSVKQAVPVTKTPEIPEVALANLPKVNGSNWGINFVQPIKKSHVYLDNNVEAYRVVYANKQTSGELVSSLNQTFNIDSWTVVENELVTINGHVAKYQLLRSLGGKERLLVYWYRAGDYVAVKTPLIKLWQAWLTLFKPQMTAEFLALSVQVDNASHNKEMLFKAAERLSQQISTQLTVITQE